MFCDSVVVTSPEAKVVVVDTELEVKSMPFWRLPKIPSCAASGATVVIERAMTMANAGTTRRTLSLPHDGDGVRRIPDVDLPRQRPVRDAGDRKNVLVRSDHVESVVLGVEGEIRDNALQPQRV